MPNRSGSEVIRVHPFPLDDTGETAIEASIAPEDYPSVFAAGMPQGAAAVAAVSQRPIAVAAFDEPASAAAWKTLPSWAVVAIEGQAINPDEERFMAERAGAKTIEVEASHAVMVVEPGAVADEIRAALRGVAAAGAA